MKSNSNDRPPILQDLGNGSWQPACTSAQRHHQHGLARSFGERGSFRARRGAFGNVVVSRHAELSLDGLISWLRDAACWRSIGMTRETSKGDTQSAR